MKRAGYRLRRPESGSHSNLRHILQPGPSVLFHHGRSGPSEPSSSFALRCICVAALTLAIVVAACSGPDAFEGTELTSRNPAPAFALSNQFGETISLSDYEGKVVVLSFLYTSCPDICPVVTSHLRDALRMLGEDADDVRFVAITVDPERDTVEAVRAFLEKWEMLDEWAFLVGDRARLSPIWKAYYLDPTLDEQQDGGPDNVGASAHHDAGRAGALQQQALGRYLVNHSAPVYLIDRQARMRVVFTLPFDPEAVAHDVTLLLK